MKHYNLGNGYPLCGVKRKPGGTVNAHAKVTCAQCKASLLKTCSTCRAQEHVSKQVTPGD